MHNAEKDNLTIHRASTIGEIVKIQMFRYQVYAAEMGMDLPGIDHQRRILADPLDRDATHIYAKAGENLAGSVRLNWNVVPAGLETQLEVALLPKPFFYCSRLYVLKQWRGHGIVNLLAEASFAEFRRRRASAAICHCYPHLLNLYKRMGFSPYGTPFRAPRLEHHGLQTPMRRLLVQKQSSHAA